MSDQAADDPTPRVAVLRARLWPRAAIMVAFAVMVALAETLLLVIAVVQALWLGFTGAPNERVARFGAQLGVWLQAVARFQSCADEERPFPWADWPAAPVEMRP